MRSIKAVAISWTLWGIAYYLYSPYLTVFLKTIIEKDLVGVLYVISTFIGLLYVLLPLYTRKIKEITVSSLIISGIGLIILGFANNLLTSLLALILYSFYWVSVPVFYLLMRGNVTKVWAISMTPALIIPFISGEIVKLGLRDIFIISGIFMSLTALPLLSINLDRGGFEGGENKINLKPLMFTIIPLSIALPYLYINIPLSLIPIAYAIGELLGILMTLYMSKIKNGLSLSLIVFSLISLSNVTPIGVIFYGISEALTALGIDNTEIHDLKNSVKITFAEASLWLIGYLIATLLFIISPFLPTVYSSLIALLFALLLLLSIPLTVLIKLICKHSHCEQKLTITLEEGIFPYFKFA